MKKFVLAAAALATATIMSRGAYAADLPVKAPAYKAATPLYDWSGYYAGGNVGALWSSGDSRWDPLPIGTNPPGFGVNVITQSLKDASFGSGVHLGYNYIFMPHWVAGIEADWTWTDNKTSGTTGWTIFGTATPVTGFTTMSRKVEWLSTIRGRIGYTVTPQALLYATGGFAFGHVKYDATATNTAGFTATTAPSATKTGYALGGGLEWALTGHWLLRGEYLFYHLGSEPTTTVFAPTSPTAFPSGFTWDSINIHTARLGLSYKFGN
jgi:outer membrane immunogenic protein